MVFVPKHGNPEYEEPKDEVAPEKGNLTDFRANILQETANTTTGLGAALTLAATVVSMPISAGAQSNRAVSLKGIDTTGVRLTTNALDKLIASSNTSQAAATELSRGFRVFIVQEIYKATSLELHAEDSRSLDLTLNNGKPVANCKQSGQSSNTNTGSGTSQTDQKNTTPKTGGTSGSSTGVNSRTENKATTAASKQEGQTGSTSSTTSADTLSKLEAGIAVCKADDFTLGLTTKEAIPFAVRLAELELAGGSVRRRRGSILQGTLGGDEISRALINDEAPVIGQLTRRSSTQPR
jgi:hypothetical protein